MPSTSFVRTRYVFNDSQPFSRTERMFPLTVLSSPGLTLYAAPTPSAVPDTRTIRTSHFGCHLATSLAKSRSAARRSRNPSIAYSARSRYCRSFSGDWPPAKLLQYLDLAEYAIEG